ncbi:MAG: sulfate transporter CysZ [Gammaproteobacteria bacterium]|jgi:CysZ protein
MKHKNPFSGIHYLFRGFNMLTTPGIKRFVIIPLIINIILFSLLIGLGYHFISYLISLLPHWLHWLSWLIIPIFFIASSIIIIYIFTIVANLIGAPFNSLLSEKVQLLTTGKKPREDEGFKEAIKDIPRTLKREWHKIVYYIPRALLLLILFFIPIINVIAGILWFVFGCWMMAVEYVDYPMDNHKKPFKELHHYLHTHCLQSLTFGASVAIISMIPVINFFVMPAAVIGGTLMYLENSQ